jgi:DNA-directed RNA polymerase specialized sigma24 family protein
MDLATLVRRCQAETERFYHGQPNDSRFAYELFRRALVERDEAAWTQLYHDYRVMVERWVHRTNGVAGSGESSEFFVVEAFTRFWRAIPPERFASFPTLGTLLNYLQRCAASVVIDRVRCRAWAEMLPEEAIPIEHGPQTSPDEEALARVDRAEFWEHIGAQLRCAVERALVYDSFVLGMKPAEIYKRRPELFTSIGEVYTIKRNVLTRLRHDPLLRAMV